jgi:hypothetical protein
MVKRMKAHCTECQEVSECEVLGEASVRPEGTSLATRMDQGGKRSKFTLRCPKCGSIFTHR